MQPKDLFLFYAKKVSLSFLEKKPLKSAELLIYSLTITNKTNTNHTQEKIVTFL